MNARQKAKHYKKLYETSLSRYEVRFTPQYTTLEHLQFYGYISPDMRVECPPDFIEKYLSRRICDKLTPVLKPYIEVWYKDGKISEGTLDVWVRKPPIHNKEDERCI